MNTAPDTTECTATRPANRNAVNTTTVIAVSVVAVVAAVVSFMHMYELATRAGEDWRAWFIPLAIDGLVVAASMTMLVRRRNGQKAGWLAWTSITLGLTASLAANIAAAEPTLIGRAVAAWPPVALLLAYELLMDQLRTAPRQTHTTPATATDMPSHQPPPARDLAAVPTTTATHNITPRHDKEPSSSPDRIPMAMTTTPPSPPLVPFPDRDDDSAEALRQAARQRYLQTLTDGLPASGREIANMYGMSERWGRYQIRAARHTNHNATTSDSART